MSEWKDFIFSDIAEFSYGTMPRKDKLGQGDYPTFSGYRYQYKYPEFNCDKGDLIVVARGVGGAGDVKIVREKCYLTNLSIKIKADNSTLDNRFFFYSFAQETLRYLDSGSAQSQITISDLGKVVLNLPPLQEQKAIASVLSSLDDKIDLLHRQNTTLEAMAETLFRQWFVEEAQENWEDGRVSNLVNILSGFAFKSTSFNDNGEYKLITIKAVQDGYLELNSADKIRELPKNLPSYCVLTHGDILLSLTGNVGRCCIVDAEKLLLNQRVAKLQPKKQRDWAFTYVLFRQASMKLQLEELAKGTAQANLSPIETANMELKIPPDSILESFSLRTRPLLEKLLKNKKQVQTLEKLRDNLLPKLMSGEIRVTH